MSIISVSHPYNRILPRDAFLVFVDIQGQNGEPLKDFSVAAKCADLKLDLTHDIVKGKRESNGDVRLGFGVSSFRSHSSYQTSKEERIFPIEIELLNEEGNCVEKTTFPLKMTML